MAQYKVKAPDGQSYTIEGPEGASDDDIINAVVAQYPEASTAAPPAPERGGFERFTDSFKEASQYGFPGLVARKWYDWTDAYKPELKQKFPGRSEDWYEQQMDTIISQSQRGLREDMAARQEADPTWRPDSSFWENVGSIDRWGPYLAGQILGSAGPESVVNPGGSAAARIGGQALMGGLSDIGYQAADIYDDVKDQIDEVQTLGAAAFGAGLQGVFEVPSFIRNLFKERGVDTTPSADPRQTPDVPEQVQPWANEEEFMGATEALLADPAATRADFDVLAQQYGRSPFGEDLDIALANRGEAQVVSGQPRAPDDHVNYVVDEVNKIAGKWKNAPEIEIVNTVNDIPDESIRNSIGGDESVVGFVGEDGKVRIVASKVQTPEDIQAVTFHEALGHAGLAQKYQEGLDDLLLKMDNESDGWFSQRVDEWVARNPDAYADAPNPRVRAADEVLAELSEGGELPVKFLDRVKNYIKDIARSIGMKNVDFSEREIKTILGMAHQSVIKGDGLAAAIPVIKFKTRTEKIREATEQLSKVKNGETKTLQPFADEEPDYWRFRHRTKSGELVSGNYTINPETGNIENFSIYGSANEIGPSGLREIVKALRKEHPEATTLQGMRISGARKASGKGYEEIEVPITRFKREEGTKASLSPETIKTENDLDDLLDFMAAETKDLKEGPQSIPEIERRARDIGLTPKGYIGRKGLSEQDISAQLRAAHDLVTNQMEELAGLAAKAETEGLSPSLKAAIYQKMAVAKAVYAKFDNDSSEVGRALRVLKEASTSKRLSSKIDSALGMVDDDEQLLKFLKNFEALHRTGGTEEAAKFFSNARRLHWEDYADAVLSNAMLSSPRTWMINAGSAPVNFLNDLVSDGVGAVLGQGKKLTNSELDRKYGREIAARVIGSLTAFRNFQTYKNVYEAFKTGQTSYKSSDKFGSRRGTVLPGPLTAIETPRRVMAGVDEIWRNIFNASNLYGEIAHDVAKSGLKGAEFWDELSRQASSPPEEIVKRASAITERQLFNDTPSKYSQRLLDALEPRYNDIVEVRMVMGEDGKLQPVAKTTKAKNTQIERVAKYAAHSVVRFIPTLDAITRTAIRNAGPFALLSKEIRQDIMKGGAAGDAALGRILVSSSLMSYFAMKAAAGEITGPPDPDYKKEASLSAARPPLSIKIGDEWVSYQGFDPLATNLAASAAMMERSGGKPVSQEAATGLIIGMASALKTSSYAESLSNFLEALLEAEKAITEGEDRLPALTNILTSQVAIPANPAFVRWVNQEFLDPYARDTRGDKSVKDRTLGRIQAGTPEIPYVNPEFNSENLPQKYDVYGREILNPRQPRKVEADPVVLEITKLEGLTDTPVMVQAPQSFRLEGETIKLPADAQQEWQRVMGYYTLEGMRGLISTKEWKNASDEEKVEIVKEVHKEAYDVTKEYMLPLLGLEEPEEVDEYEDEQQ